MIVSVTLNPCVDQVLFVAELRLHDSNRVKRVETDAGGKGVNVSRVVAELGVQGVATGLLGGQAADYIQAVLHKSGVHHDFVPISGSTRTNVSLEDASGRAPTTFNAVGPEISQAEWGALQAKVADLAKGAKWVTMGGSLPPGVPTNAYGLLANIARDQGAKVVIDADGEALRQALPAKPDLIKPNRAEAERLLGRAIRGVRDALEAIHDIANLAPGATVVLSLGAQGAIMAANGQVIRGYPIEVVSKSTIGSGDSMIAGILCGLVQGQSLDRAFGMGIAAGAATAMTDGTAIGNRSDIMALLPKFRAERVA